MTGQLAFVTQTCWASTLGPDAYVIVRPTNTSTPTTQYIALSLLPSVASLGGFATLEAAVNACGTNYATLSS